jgi:hypothetical protein
MSNDKKTGEKIEPTHKIKTPKPKPEHEIRQNSILISLFQKRANSGYGYWCYSIRRAFVAGSGREVFGSDFFRNNEADLIAGIKAASAFLREKEEILPEEDYELESRKHIYEYERTHGTTYATEAKIDAEAEPQGE